MSRKANPFPEYKDMQIGDVVCCDVRGFFPIFTRAVTGGGIRHAFDHEVSTHTGILFGLGRQLLLAEMLRKGITPGSLERYRKHWDERIIAVRRPVVRDVAAYQQAVQEGVGEIVRRSVEYDYDGLLEFISDRVKDNKGRLYCSEMVYVLTRDHVTEPYPEAYGMKVSPQDLLTCPQYVTVWHR